MTIPTIAPYEMPTDADLPQNRVSWEPDPERSVLLVHDVQRYFLDVFASGQSPVAELLANIGALRERCSGLGVPVVYTGQPGGQTPAQRGLLQDFWGPGIGDDPREAQIVEELAPDGGDIVLTKWRYSAFRRTELSDLLRERSRDQIIVCGVYAHIGCLLTACDAFMQDLQPFFVADAVADFSPEHHRMALTYAAQHCALTISTRRLLDELSAVRPEAPAPANGDGILTLDLLREHVAEVLYESPSDIADDEDLTLRGLDSVRIMSLVERWRASGAEVSFVELAERPTLAHWRRLLSSGSSQAASGAGRSS